MGDLTFWAETRSERKRHQSPKISVGGETTVTLLIFMLIMYWNGPDFDSLG